MKIKAEIRSIFQDSGKLKAVSNLVIEDCFVVKNVRVIDGKNGLFVSMPSRQNADGKYSDICFPQIRGPGENRKRGAGCLP